ncbi:hypothetical protein FOQG_07327 [Fusarium oxysporum f. sp. raphani 54005]|uniref:Uncharacterized protein n=2 Tax=Fusarium oxysporum TaxID=5507 RepID=X0C5Z2_FUSOX|nr:hypothetical protein FOWG_07308 [Fusarium oxysporum f. sp. lycopersici MN25]EXK89825.1 hypothetical protein FOQG_07327 [Fusarium oxysporum f. sp. raphani 54005]EXL49471.1 hypothetical protein FOCG_09818 [Fusarium oxysporum f. sp. radicis-lycopersici 26381]EXL69765.1 hypothetical protein FOPG_14329 [Fusarium oxysporum f. sp. conglutinans race 2 54008]
MLLVPTPLIPHQITRILSLVMAGLVRAASNWLTPKSCPVLSNQPLTLNMVISFRYLPANQLALLLVRRNYPLFPTAGLTHPQRSVLFDEIRVLISDAVAFLTRPQNHPVELLFLSPFVWVIGQTPPLLLASRRPLLVPL